MTQELRAPAGVDPTVPAPARIYDYILGGKHNFPADQKAGQQLSKLIPEAMDAAWANRGFHQRAARWLADEGIRQYIDIGSGLPTVGNTHEIVQHLAPGPRVVYVDNDPMVLAYSAELLKGNADAAVILADLRDPPSVLEHADLRALIDFSQPMAMLMTAVLHFVAPGSNPWALVARYIDVMPPGSYLAVSHVTDDKTPPEKVNQATQVYSSTPTGIYFRGAADIARFFDGLKLVAPTGTLAELVHVGEWGAEDPELADSDGSRWLYCAIGRKP